MHRLKAIALDIASRLPQEREEAQKVLGLVADLLDWEHSADDAERENDQPISFNERARSSGNPDGSPA